METYEYIALQKKSLKFVAEITLPIPPCEWFDLSQNSMSLQKSKIKTLKVWKNSKKLKVLKFLLKAAQMTK